jgi:hypothetical protein
MDETGSILMAALDFLPVLAFLAGILLLVMTAHLLKAGLCQWLFTISGALIFLGGLLQATWKFLYFCDICDYRWMSNAQFILMGPGFLLFLIAVISLSRQTRPNRNLSLILMTPWKIPLLAVMTLSSLAAYGLLAVMSLRKKLPVAYAGFLLALLGVLAMGFLASRPQTISMQWLEQSVNTGANIAFAVGCYQIFRWQKAQANYQAQGLLALRNNAKVCTISTKVFYTGGKSPFASEVHHEEK